MRLDMSSVNQDIPSTRPSPVTALHAWIFQCRFSKISSLRSRASAISSFVCAPTRSCFSVRVGREKKRAEKGEGGRRYVRVLGVM